MSNVIVGIHGLANKPPSEILKECWAEAIKEGLNETCRPMKFAPVAPYPPPRWTAVS